MDYTLQQYYNLNHDDTNRSVRGTYWKAQTFTTVNGFTIARVSCKLYRSSTGIFGNLTCEIRATSSNLPTGAALATSGTLDASTITTDSGGEWYNFDFAGYALSATTEYAIILRHSALGFVWWLCDSSSPSYAGGNYCTSADSGSTWLVDTDKDFMFETYSEGAVDYLDATGSCTFSLTAFGDAELLDVLNAAGAATFSFTIEGDAILSHMPINAGGMSSETKLRIVAVGNNSLYYEDVD